MFIHLVYNEDKIKNFGQAFAKHVVFCRKLKDHNQFHIQVNSRKKVHMNGLDFFGSFWALQDISQKLLMATFFIL